MKRLRMVSIVSIAVLLISVMAACTTPTVAPTVAPTAAPKATIAPTAAPVKPTETKVLPTATVAAQPKTLTYAEPNVVNMLDAIDPRGYPNSYEAVFLLYDQLVRFDEKMQIKPELAKSWEVSADGLTWTFKLVEGVKFHDGTPFNADAVKKHVERALSAEWASPNKSLWAHITKVEVVDAATIKFSTAEPFGPMLYYLAHGSGGIVSPTAVDKYKKDIAINPVGTGPYKLESFNPGVELVLVRNDNYWNGKPALDKVVFKKVTEAQARQAMLEKGEAQIISEVPPESVKTLKTNTKLKIIEQTGLRTFFVALNLTRPALQDVKVRQALNYAVDKDAIVNAIFLGLATPMDSPAAQNIAGHVTIGTYKYDPAKAKQLLAEAGWKDTNNDKVVDKDGKPLSLKYLISNEYPKAQEVAEAVQQYLQDVGVKVELWYVDSASVRTYQKVAQKEAQYDMANWAFNASNGDISYHLESMWVTNPDVAQPPYMWNLGWYSNPKVDQVIKATKLGKDAVDPAKRQTLLAEAQKLIWEDAPHIWLYVPKLLAGQSADVDGLTVMPTVFYNMRNVRYIK